MSITVRQVLDKMLERQRQFEQIVKPKGLLRTELWRGGKVISIQEVRNGVTNVGKDAMLGIMFHADTQITSWYHGLINNASYSAVAAADTMASHAGWIEFTGYSQGTRPQWSPGAASGQSITNNVAMQFSINASGSLQGGFIVSNSTKSGTTGTLWATALYSTPLIVDNGDIVRNTYTVSLT